MQVSDAIMDSFSYSFTIPQEFFPPLSKKSSKAKLFILPYSSSSETSTYSFLA